LLGLKGICHFQCVRQGCPSPKNSKKLQKNPKRMIMYRQTTGSQSSDSEYLCKIALACFSSAGFQYIEFPPGFPQAFRLSAGIGSDPSAHEGNSVKKKTVRRLGKNPEPCYYQVNATCSCEHRSLASPPVPAVNHSERWLYSQAINLVQAIQLRPLACLF